MTDMMMPNPRLQMAWEIYRAAMAQRIAKPTGSPKDPSDLEWRSVMRCCLKAGDLFWDAKDDFGQKTKK